MALVASEYFDSYSNGNELNTLNGGTGWSGAWISSPTSIYQVSNAQAVSSSLSLKCINTGGSALRSFSGLSSQFSHRFFIYITSIGNYFQQSIQDTSGNNVLYIQIQTNGNVDVYYGGGFHTMTTWTGKTNRWIEVVISYNFTGSKVKYWFDGISSGEQTQSVGAAIGKISPFHYNVNGYLDNLEIYDSIYPPAATTNPAFLLNFI